MFYFLIIFRFVVLTDSKTPYEYLEKRLYQIFNNTHLKKFSLEQHEIWYPESEKAMQNLYRPCATERLFLKDLLPYDSIIYVDTDILFLEPPEKLWQEFAYFERTDVAALGPVLSPHYLRHSEVS